MTWTAPTAITICNNIFRRTGQSASKSAFSDTDDTNFVLQHMNDALEHLQDLKSTYIDAEATFSVVNNQRLYANPVSGLDINDIYDWSWRLVDQNNVPYPLNKCTLEFIMESYPKFETDTAAIPELVYIDENQIALYALPDNANLTFTGKFRYPTTATYFVNTTDTVNYPQKWILFIEKYAQLHYEVWKGIGAPQVTGQEVDDLYSMLMVKTRKNKKTRITGYRRFRKPQVY